MRNHRIMIVEDEVVVAQDIKNSLEDLGYEVTSMVTSGEEAVKRAKIDGPDLVLMDIILAERMDGVEAASKIRSKYQTPIVYLTANMDEAIIQRAKLTEPYGYIIKPFEESELYSIIEIALHKQKKEKMLKKSEIFFRGLVETTSNFLWEIDANNAYVYLSPQSKDILGYTPQKLKGHTFTGIPPGNKRFYDLITSFVHNDGWPIILESSGVPVFDNQGTFLGYRGITRDVTDRKHSEEVEAISKANLEQILEKRTKQLCCVQAKLTRSDKLSELGELVGTVCHDLRNPLASVHCSIAIMEEGLKKNRMDLVDRSLELAKKSIKRCDLMVDELLNYSRVKGLDLKITDIDLWLKTTLSELNIPKDIECTLNFNSKVWLSIDSEAFRRVIVNTVNNAIEALKDEAVVEKQLCIETDIDGQKLTISIKDSGSGITEDIMENIFEPLFSTKHGGVGLGVPIIRNIMKQHGGGVEYLSKQGKGTIVNLWLPMLP